MMVSQLQQWDLKPRITVLCLSSETHFKELHIEKYSAFNIEKVQSASKCVIFFITLLFMASGSQLIRQFMNLTGVSVLLLSLFYVQVAHGFITLEQFMVRPQNKKNLIDIY